MTTKVNNRMIDGADINVIDFGADPTGVVESSAAINAALLYAAENGGKRVICEGSFRIDNTINMSTGAQLIGRGPRDGLNSLTRTAGTLFQGTADPMVQVWASDELPQWPQDAGGSANITISGICFFTYTGGRLDATAIQVGTETAGVRNMTIDDIETRGYDIGIDIVGAYTLFLTRLSLRGLGRGTGTRGVRFREGEVTSGYLAGAAIYELEVAIEINSGTFAGFQIRDVDTDACNHVATTEGFISNPSLFMNIASEGTVTSDFIFGHSSGIAGLIGFSTVVGTTTDHRIRCVGAGATSLSNISLNSSLFAPGKTGLSQEGSGTVRVYDSSLNPNFAVSDTSAGDVYLNGDLYSEIGAIAILNFEQGFDTVKTVNLQLGGTPDERTLILDLSRLNPGGGMIITKPQFDGTPNVMDVVSVLRNGNNASQVIHVQQISAGLVATYTVTNNETLEISWSGSYNNSPVMLVMPSSIDIRRKA